MNEISGGPYTPFAVEITHLVSLYTAIRTIATGKNL